MKTKFTWGFNIVSSPLFSLARFFSPSNFHYDVFISFNYSKGAINHVQKKKEKGKVLKH